MFNCAKQRQGRCSTVAKQRQARFSAMAKQRQGRCSTVATQRQGRCSAVIYNMVNIQLWLMEGGSSVGTYKG